MTRYAAKGTLLQIGDGSSPEGFTTIAQISRVGGIEIVTETEDVTDHGSTDYFREHVETVLAYGDISFEGHWDPATATHISLKTAAEAGAGPTNWKMIWVPSTTTAAFAATLTSLTLGDAPVDGKLPLAGSLKISGKITWS